MHIHVNSHVAHVWLLYTVINVQEGHHKLGRFRKLQKIFKGGREH